MRKSAHDCGAKHISKSKCTKRFSSGALVNVKKVHAAVELRTIF